MAQTSSLGFWLVPLLAGAVSGFLTASLMSGPEESALADATATPAAVDADWEARVAALESLQAEHAATLRAWASAPPSAAEPREALRQPDGDWVTREEFEAFRQEIWRHLQKIDSGLQEPAGEGPGAPIASNPKKQDAKQIDDRAARLEDEVRAYSNWLGFDEVQETQWREAIAMRQQRSTELIDAWRAGSLDDAGMAQRKQQDDAAFQADLTRILRPDQLATYQTKFGDGSGGSDK